MRTYTCVRVTRDTLRSHTPSLEEQKMTGSFLAGVYLGVFLTVCTSAADQPNIGQYEFGMFWYRYSQNRRERARSNHG